MNSGDTEEISCMTFGRIADLMYIARQADASSTSFSFNAATFAIADYMARIPTCDWKDYFVLQDVNPVKQGFTEMTWLYMDEYGGIVENDIQPGLGPFIVLKKLERLFRLPPFVTPITQLFLVKLYEAKNGSLNHPIIWSELGIELGTIAERIPSMYPEFVNPLLIPVSLKYKYQNCLI